jgi:PEP-CTERM motif
MRRVGVGTFILVLAMAVRANASPIVISNIVGGWQNANPAANATINNQINQLVDQARWGSPAGGTGQSGYDFDPTDNPVNYVLGTPFALGVFTHINQPIVAGTSIVSIDYNLSFSTNGTPSTLNDIFNFAHNETPNDAPCPSPSVPIGCDIVTISSVNLNSVIDVGGELFFFNLVGFSTNGGATTQAQFFSAEGGSNSATLYGMLTTQPIVNPLNPVPEPASLLLMGAGLVILARRVAARKK